MDTAAAILKLRTLLGLSQQKFANLLGQGRSLSVVQKAESGERGPGIDLFLEMKQLAEETLKQTPESNPELEQIVAAFRDELYRKTKVSWEAVAPFEPVDDLERTFVAALLYALRNPIPKLSNERAAVFEALEPYHEIIIQKIRSHQLRLRIQRSFRAFVKRVVADRAGRWDEKNKRLVFYREGARPETGNLRRNFLSRRNKIG